MDLVYLFFVPSCSYSRRRLTWPFMPTLLVNALLPFVDSSVDRGPEEKDQS
jgi:hypothetical protein